MTNLLMVIRPLNDSTFFYIVLLFVFEINYNDFFNIEFCIDIEEKNEKLIVCFEQTKRTRYFHYNSRSRVLVVDKEM
jgi:hypothetical protein